MHSFDLRTCPNSCVICVYCEFWVNSWFYLISIMKIMNNSGSRVYHWVPPKRTAISFEFACLVAVNCLLWPKYNFYNWPIGPRSPIDSHFLQQDRLMYCVDAFFSVLWIGIVCVIFVCLWRVCLLLLISETIASTAPWRGQTLNWFLLIMSKW